MIFKGNSRLGISSTLSNIALWHCWCCTFSGHLIGMPSTDFEFLGTTYSQNVTLIWVTILKSPRSEDLQLSVRELKTLFFETAILLNLSHDLQYDRHHCLFCWPNESMPALDESNTKIFSFHQITTPVTGSQVIVINYFNVLQCLLCIKKCNATISCLNVWNDVLNWCLFLFPS